MQTATPNKAYFPWLMWLFPLSFFGFQFILRLFPGLIMPEIMSKYAVNASQFGMFASLYYLGYAAMQIPMALLLDKYGPRLIISGSAILCGLACWMVVYFDGWYWALLSRFFIGVGSVVGFLGTSKVISVWFPKSRYAKLVALTFSFGLLGALYGGRPVSVLIESFNWETVLNLLGAAAIIIGLLVLIFLRHRPQATTEPAMPLGASFKALLTNKPLLYLAVGNLLMVGALEGFADVWGVPFLMQSLHLSKTEAASIISFIFMGMLVGGPILAWVSDKCGSYYTVTIGAGLIMALALTAFILFNTVLSSFLLYAIMFGIGALCCYQVLVFAIGTQLVPDRLMNITVAFLNCINMLGGFFFHTLIGYCMDWFEPTTLVQGAQIYSTATFTSALMVIPLASLVGATLIWRSHYRSSVAGTVALVKPA